MEDKSDLSKKVTSIEQSMNLSTAIFIDDMKMAIDATSHDENISTNNLNSSLESSISFKDNIEEIKSK